MKYDQAIYIMVLPQDKRAVKYWIKSGYDTLNTIEPVKYFKQYAPSTQKQRKIEVFGYLLNMLVWAREEYRKEERELLQAFQEFAGAEGSRKEMLMALTKGIREWLKSKVAK